MRNILDFNENWCFDGETVTLPHCYSELRQAVYQKSFPKPKGERVFLKFEASAMIADVTLNGFHIAHHEGGYSAFTVELTERLREENTITVTTDNTANDRVYPQKADFTFYGGLYRGVKLITTPEEYIERVLVTPTVDLEAKTATVTVKAEHNAGTVEITVNGETKRVHDTAEFVIANVRLWNGLSDPYLYSATARLDSGDEVRVKFGCREFHVDPKKGFFLNGRPYPLRGVSRHQDMEGAGSALTIEHHREDMAVIREIGANTVRLAHYQQAQEFYDLCDENGIIVWAEIPYITEHMPKGRENTLSQMRELVTQCYNHPSIVCWGISNEITASGAVTEDMLENHRLLNDLCHELDPTRLTTMAHVFMLETDSPITEIPDIGSYNLYYGWYLGELTQNEQFFDEYHAKFPDRVIGFSEYGADANPQFHSAKPERGDYSEEYQCVYHEHILKVIEERPYLWATHVWNLFDFSASGRDEGGKKGQNQKGLVCFNHKTRKDAFYLYKAAWSKDPFIHLCGKRYADRAENETEIKVYSNCDTVALYMDGKLHDKRSGKRVFTFTVPITGEHKIKAVSGDLSDTMIVRHVDKPNPDYSFAQEIINWFDKDSFDPTAFSVKDTLGALMANPETGKIVGAMMAAATESRGEVAKSASQNEALQKMMAATPLETLLRQAGPNVVTPDEIKELNETLQRVKK